MQLTSLVPFLTANFLLAPFVFTTLLTGYHINRWAGSTLLSIPYLAAGLVLYSSRLMHWFRDAARMLRLVTLATALASVFLVFATAKHAFAFAVGFTLVRASLVLLGNLNRQLHGETNDPANAAAAFSYSVIISNAISLTAPVLVAMLFAQAPFVFMTRTAGFALMLFSAFSASVLFLLPRKFSSIMIHGKSLARGSRQRLASEGRSYAKAFFVSIAQFQIFVLVPILASHQASQATRWMGYFYAVSSAVSICAAAIAARLLSRPEWVSRLEILGGVCPAAALVALLVSVKALGFWGGAVLMGISQGIFLPAILAEAQTVKDPDARRSKVTDLTFLTSVAAPSLAPVAGLVLSSSPPPLSICMIVVCIATCYSDASGLFLNRQRRVV